MSRSQGCSWVRLLTTSSLLQWPDNTVSGRVNTCSFYLVVYQLGLYAAAPKNKIVCEWSPWDYAKVIMVEGQTGLFEDSNSLYLLFFLAISSTCWARFPKKPVSFRHSCYCYYIANRSSTSHLKRPYSWLGISWIANGSKVNHSVISLMRKGAVLTEW